MPIVLTPVITPPAPAPAPTGVSWTLGQYRHRVAEETGNFVASTVATASTTFLQDNRYPVRSSLDQGDLYTGKWLLRPDAADARDRVRIVAERGYDPGTGVLRPDGPWFTVPVTDERYELHGVIEPWEHLKDLVNEALKRCFLVDHLVLAVDPGTRHLNLTPYAPWLLDRRWVRGAAFVDPDDYEDPAEVDLFDSTFRGQVDQQGRAMLLRWQNTPWQSGQVLVVRVIRRHYDYCRAAPDGAFGERSGLAAETDECPAAEDWVTAAVMTDFWDEFGNVVAAGNRQEAEANQAKWAEQFTTITQGYFTLPPNTLLQPVLRGWSPGWY